MKTYFPNQPERPALPGPSEPEYVYYTPEPEEVNLLDYWKILLKRRRLIIGVVLVLVVLGAYFNFTATPMYKATTTIKIEPANPSVTGIAELNRLNNEGGGPYDYYQTQFKLLASRDLAARVISDLRLKHDKRFTSSSVVTENPFLRIQGWVMGWINYFVSPIVEFFTHYEKEPVEQEQADSANLQAGTRQTTAQGEVIQQQVAAKATPRVSPGLVARYDYFLKLAPIKGTRLVDISFSTPSPSLSKMLADAHAKGFIRMNLESRFQLTKEAREFLDAKNAELKEKLQRSEAELNKFRQAHGVVSIEKGENIVVDRLVDLNRQLTTARAQRLEAESLNSVVQNKSTQYLTQVLTQGLIPTLRGTLVSLEAEKVKQSTIFKPDHPRMIELNQRIKEARQSLNGEIANVVRGIRENFVAARAKEQALDSEAQRQQQRALELKEIGVEYAVLQEEVNVNKNLYESILRRLSETHISSDLVVSNMQIAQAAERPRRPSSPNIPINFVLYVVTGLFLGAGLAFFLAFIDSRLHTPDHVLRAVDLGTFGVVPDIDSISRGALGYVSGQSRALLPNRTTPALPGQGKDLMISHHPLSIFSESYRTIRTALLLSNPEAPRKIILLTSPSPGEGKTATTLNLATALAQDRFRVVVVDTDLRRGSCHSRLGLRNQRGLSHLLTGNIPVSEAIQQSSVERLWLLSRGNCPPNPSELLGTPRMKEILQTLRESYDFVLLDSPPAIAVSDPAILSTLADGIILVFHAKKTTKASARQAKERFDVVRAPILGVILNGINVDDPDYAYYRHYYGSHYATPETDSGNGTHGASKTATRENLNTQSPRPAEFKANLMESGNVPSRFFDLVLAKLTEAVGPMAPVIIDDHIALLGESRNSFPRNRLRELFEGISEEILDKNLKARFENSVLNEMQSL